MEVQEAIRLQALRNVLRKKDAELELRRIFRWYSREFHTPLHDVEHLDPLQVMLHYWECKYDDAEGPDLWEEREQLLEPEEKRLDRARRDEDDLVDKYETARWAEEEERLEADRRRAAKVAAKVPDKTLVGPRRELTEEEAEAVREMTGHTAVPPVDAPQGTTVPEGITMSFDAAGPLADVGDDVDESELDALDVMRAPEKPAK